MDISCPECGEEIHIENGWEYLGADITCPVCNALLELNYNEVVDSDGLEHGTFYFEVLG